LRERKAAFDTQPPKALPRRNRAFRTRRHNALALEDVNNSGRIEAAGAP